jgi:hypothetical protein
MGEESGTIQIPKRIIEQIHQRLPQTDFKTVDDYVTFVLEEVLREVDDQETDKSMSEEDEKKVKERLKALGYLE